MRVKLLYASGKFVSLTLEVSTEEAGGLTEPDAVISAEADEWFALLGLPALEPIPMLPLTHQIAQKLHACTAPDDPGWVNDRVHDLVDLQLAMQSCKGELSAINRVAVRLFAARRLHSWPPAVTARSGWEDRYTVEAKGLEVVPTLREALEWANALIETISSASAGHIVVR